MESNYDINLLGQHDWSAAGTTHFVWKNKAPELPTQRLDSDPGRVTSQPTGAFNQ